LAVGGRLVFDISKWDIHMLACDPGQRYPLLCLKDAARGEITIEETAEYSSSSS
jgi:hypothetical protein